MYGEEEGAPLHSPSDIIDFMGSRGTGLLPSVTNPSIWWVIEYMRLRNGKVEWTAGDIIYNMKRVNWNTTLWIRGCIPPVIMHIMNPMKMSGGTEYAITNVFIQYRF